uniref:Helicase ATP-binding domain-containing protein n=1 Tax=viral metagenome TaxID=1070528 RepID=A0A6C0HFY1_9ZZZZ
MLCQRGYRILKRDVNVHHIKGCLTVKPYIPSVFVKPQFVKKHTLFTEDDEYLYVPKHYGHETFGPFLKTDRDVPKTPDVHWFFNGSLRDVQIPVVDSFLKPEPHDGIISLQTGGGKTICALYIASRLKVPTIILVHNTFLKDQWVDRIKAFLPKARIGFLQGDTVDIDNKDVIVAMLQSLSLKDYGPIFGHIGFTIVDECHHIASDCFSRSIPKVTSKYMLGLSATPERKDRLMHVIHWLLGPLLYKSNTADKVDDQAKVEYYEFEPSDPKFNEIILNPSGVMFTSLMVNKVVASEERNKFLVEILEDVYSDPERRILVLTDRVEHTKKLMSMFPEKMRADSGILSRDVKSDQRQVLMETKRILLGTYQMCKEGFDLPSLNTLMMATSRPDVDQILGRIMRQEKGVRKVHPLILDVVDPAFRRQFQERLTLYKSRQYIIEKTKMADS